VKFRLLATRRAAPPRVTVFSIFGEILFTKYGTFRDELHNSGIESHKSVTNRGIDGKMRSDSVLDATSERKSGLKASE
jgi:hypothetical protein